MIKKLYQYMPSFSKYIYKHVSCIMYIGLICEKYEIFQQ